MKIKNTNFETDITLHLARISGDVEHIKTRLDTVVEHLEKINGRLRIAENNITAHKAVGITMVTILTLAISLVGLIR
jgi:DNA anti-recombination protein RmuC